MPGGAIHAVQIVFLLLLLFVAVFAALAQKLETPYPIVLVLAGLALGFIPGIPRIALRPDLVFFVLLPPLLYAAAWTTSWRDFSYNLVSIGLLAVSLLRLVWLAAGGIAVGLLLARVVEWLERRIEDAPIEITISILVPYGAYLAGEAIHASGVLAVVACGLYLSRKSAEFFSPNVRIQIYSVWSSLTFILNGVVFVLIGLQLP